MGSMLPMRMRLKNTAYLMLGMLRLGVGSGYGIKKAVDRSTRFFWATSFAQVYAELSRLEAGGLLTRRDAPQGNRRRSVYELSAGGQEALLDWLRSPRIEPPQVRAEGVLRLFFADALTADEQVSLVRRLRADAERIAQEIRGDIFPLAEEISAAEGPRFPLVTAQLGADVYAHLARWFADLEAELVMGASGYEA